MKQKVIIMVLFITWLACQFTCAQEDVVLQNNEIPDLRVHIPVRMGHWPIGFYPNRMPVEVEGVRQHVTIQGITLSIKYGEFANTNEAHWAVAWHSTNHAAIFYPGLWDGVKTNSIGDESWYNRDPWGNAILFRSGRIGVLVGTFGEGDREKEIAIVEMLARAIEDKIKKGGRVILTYEDGTRLPAQVRLKPEALEVSPGILTAFVRLPEGYPVTNIISATLDGAPSERMMPNEDGTEMIIKFRRKDIEDKLAQWGGSLDTHFVVRGVWHGGVKTLDFHGVASIKKIVGAKEKKK